MLPVTFTPNNATSGYKDLFFIGSHFKNKTHACYIVSNPPILNILCRSASKPPHCLFVAANLLSRHETVWELLFKQLWCGKLLRKMWANGFWLEWGTLGSMSRHKCLRSRGIGDRGHGLDACNLWSA